MLFLAVVFVMVSALCLCFLTWKRFKNGPNLARFFYAISIIAFYVALFNTEAYSFLGVVIDASVAFFLWYLIGLLIEHFSNKRSKVALNKSLKIPVADELRKLSQLKDEGILTEEEFTEQKKKLLS